MSNPSTSPVLSVVVPTRGRPRQLAELLDRLRPGRQALASGQYEVIVSDDDPSSAACCDRRDVGDLMLRFVRGPGRGPAANRNHAARHATGEWLVFTDDDCQPADGWLRAFAEAATDRPLDVLEGKIAAPETRDRLFSRDVENLTGGCYWSANLAIRRDFFARIGGFDEDFTQAGGEDMELAHRLLRQGARTAFIPEALVYHPSHSLGWRGVIEYAFRIRWHPLYLQKTGQTLPNEAPAWRAAVHVVRSRVTGLLRVTWQWASQPAGPRPRKAIFDLTTQWVLFPLLLPYLVYWDLRFRRLLRGRMMQQSVREDMVLDRGRSQ